NSLQGGASTIRNGVTVLTSAISIGTEAANGSLHQYDRQAVDAEAQCLTTELRGLATTLYQGPYSLSGAKVTSQPFTRTAATNTATYSGNSNLTSVALANGTFVKGNVPGDQLFQNASGDAFGALQNIFASLNSGNINSIGQSVTQLNAALTQVDIQRV